MGQEVKAAVRAFIQQNFIGGDGARFGDADSLLELQILDSTGFLELVNFIEGTFGIKVEDEDMIPENLETLENIEAYVVSKSAR